MKPFILVTSRKGNSYLHDTKKKKMLQCHPILKYIIKKTENGNDIENQIRLAPNKYVGKDSLSGI
jgi:hypothetical protein